jgi:hypothetical protein
MEKRGVITCPRGRGLFGLRVNVSSSEGTKRNREMNTKFLLESLKGKDHLRDLGVGSGIILKCILEKLGGRVWTVFLFFGTWDQCRVLVNTVMNLRAP